MGWRAWKRSRSWNPGIVITDLRMPRMDGMQLLEHIAAQPQQVAVILLTAQGSVDAAVSAMKSGAFDFIEKPVNPTRSAQHSAKRFAPARHRTRTGSQPPQAARRRRARLAGRPLEAHAGSFSPHRDGCPQHRFRADHRRKRYRQRISRAHHSLHEQPQGEAVRCHQLRRHSRDADRKRNLRPRERCVHRRGRTPYRLL